MSTTNETIVSTTTQTSTETSTITTPTTTTTTTTPTTTPTPTTTADSNDLTKAIIGGVVGVVLAVLVIILIVFCIRRKKRRAATTGRQRTETLPRVDAHGRQIVDNEGGRSNGVVSTNPDPGLSAGTRSTGSSRTQLIPSNSHEEDEYADPNKKPQTRFRSTHSGASEGSSTGTYVVPPDDVPPEFHAPSSPRAPVNGAHRGAQPKSPLLPPPTSAKPRSVSPGHQPSASAPSQAEDGGGEMEPFYMDMNPCNKNQAVAIDFSGGQFGAAAGGQPDAELVYMSPDAPLPPRCGSSGGPGHGYVNMPEGDKPVLSDQSSGINHYQNLATKDSPYKNVTEDMIQPVAGPNPEEEPTPKKNPKKILGVSVMFPGAGDAMKVKTKKNVRGGGSGGGHTQKDKAPTTKPKPKTHARDQHQGASNVHEHSASLPDNLQRPAPERNDGNQSSDDESYVNVPKGVGPKALPDYENAPEKKQDPHKADAKAGGPKQNAALGMEPLMSNGSKGKTPPATAPKAHKPAKSTHAPLGMDPAGASASQTELQKKLERRRLQSEDS